MDKFDYHEKRDTLNNEIIILLYLYILHYVTSEFAHIIQLKLFTGQLLLPTAYYIDNTGRYLYIQLTDEIHRSQ